MTIRETPAQAQARQRKEKKERDAKMAVQKANRLAAEAKSKEDALEQHAKRVAALYASMRKFEADAEEKAGFELKKAAEKRAALDQALAKAQELCKATGQRRRSRNSTRPTMGERSSIRSWRSPTAVRRSKVFARKSASESAGSELRKVSGTTMSRTMARHPIRTKRRKSRQPVSGIDGGPPLVPHA